MRFRPDQVVVYPRILSIHRCVRFGAVVALVTEVVLKVVARIIVRPFDGHGVVGDPHIVDRVERTGPMGGI